MTNPMLIVLVWVSCGIASIWIAQAKGARNLVAWFGVGILLGPFGIVLTLIGAKHPRVSSPTAPLPPSFSQQFGGAALDARPGLASVPRASPPTGAGQLAPVAGIALIIAAALTGYLALQQFSVARLLESPGLSATAGEDAGPWPAVWRTNMCRSFQSLSTAKTAADAIDTSIAAGDLPGAIAYAESARARATTAVDLIDAAPRWGPGRSFETYLRAGGVAILKAAANAKNYLKGGSSSTLAQTRAQIVVATRTLVRATSASTDLFNATGFQC